MCKKLIVLTLSLCLISSVGAATIHWDFENGNDHRFTFWSVYPPGNAIQDDTIAGDEELTGISSAGQLPDYGVAWTVGMPNQYDGQEPAVDEGNHIDAAGLLDYTLDDQPISSGTDFDCVNERGQSGYLNTYNLNQDGDNLNTKENDQLATSPVITLGENAVLTVWSYGGGVGTHAPEYDADPLMMYTDGSSGIVVFSAEEADMYAILATLHLQGQGTLTEDTLDLSAFAGRKVQIDVVDAFQDTWGWLAIDEIQITNVAKNAAIIIQKENNELVGGYDQAQIDHLKGLGYNVWVIEQPEIGETFTTEDANACDLLVISESPSSSTTVPISTTSAPVLHEEAYGWCAESRWNIAGERTDIRWVEGLNEVEIVNDTHPIAVAAGLSLGMMPFFDPPNSMTAELVSQMLPDAELIAQVSAEGNDYMVIFALETGSERADGSITQNRIVGLSLPGLFPTNTPAGPFAADTLTDEAWALIDAAIAWLDPPEAPPTAAMIVNDASLPNGFDQAQKDHLESLGYEVTVATGDDVSGGVFTAADAETFDVLVVSESIGSSQANNLIGANVPMMHQESYGWSRHFFTQGLNKTWLNDPNGTVNIVNDAHPIIAGAGLSAGQVTFFTDPSVAWTTDTVASLVAGAENLAQITNSEGVDYTIIFAIEAGTELADPNRVAANRVVGFSLPGNNNYAADVMTDEAWAMFDAAIAWLDSATVSIPVENFSFELPGDEKHQNWDLIPGWTSDGLVTESGVEGPHGWPGQTDGIDAAMLNGLDPSVYNQLTYVIEAGDILILSVDAYNEWTIDSYTDPVQLEMSLYYDAAGVRVPLVTGVFDMTGEYQTYTVTVNVDDVPEAIGAQLGVELNNVTPEFYSWIAVDNVQVKKEL